MIHWSWMSFILGVSTTITIETVIVLVLIAVLISKQAKSQ